jgi:hypothetical protein
MKLVEIGAGIGGRVDADGQSMIDSVPPKHYTDSK